MGTHLPTMQLLYYNLKVNIIVFSYRGYGNSEGEPSESGLKLDSEAILQYLQNDKQLRNKKIVLYGKILGASLAIHASLLKLKLNVVGLILENPFTSLDELIDYHFPQLKLIKKYI